MPKTPTLPRMALLLAALTAIGPFAIDTYLPAFHDIETTLPATPRDMQLTLAIYMATFAFMSLWHGALSDCFGRRAVIVTGGALFLVASLICALAPSSGWLLFGRGLQGMAAGAGIIVGRAMIRDLYSGALAQKLMSRVATIFAIAPAAAPILGGWILYHGGWRAVFWFLVLFSAALTWMAWKEVPETLPPEARKPLKPGSLLRAYVGIFRNREFLLLSAVLALCFNGFFVHIAAASRFVKDFLHLDETQFGWLFVPFVIGIVLGSSMSSRVAGYWSAHRTVVVAFALMAFAVAFGVIHAAFYTPGVPWTVFPILIYSTGMSLASPTLMLLTLDLYPKRRGMAASCQTFLQVGLNAITASFIAPLVWGRLLTLELGMAAFFALALVCYARWRCGKKH